MEKLKYNCENSKIKIIFYIILGIISFFLIRYRFLHPEMTETQLFINTFEAFNL